ncbi:MAG TPA: lipoprotein [Ramlibacter sp.]|jgi:predicted small lipoprotein YifL|uniref:LPS translocon maturation chaperone LptM n=1 Tax=Ramlibacter sp. TaxID=1917967 RepID=UPI002D5BCF89|nr:lipoprotein [Ramlibacter sp.]HZY18910.1 lipoprotein [Ramlibacter sp.]
MSNPGRISRGRAAPGALLAAVLVALAGCGQRGPLYLPTDPAAANRATLPQVLVPIGTPTNPTSPLPEASTGGQGTGTAAPVRNP